MRGRAVVQRGLAAEPDLFLFAHIDPEVIGGAVTAVTDAAVVAELRGLGTSAYAGLVRGEGGPAGWARACARACGLRSFKRWCLTTWSAGSQTIKDVCAAGPEEWPDAIVSLDGLYAAKPASARPGDGRVLWDAALDAVAKYALAAARGERILVITHSRIPTPYASSGEVARALRARVEAELGHQMQNDAEAAAGLGGRTPAGAWHLGNFRIVEFVGANAAEHIAQARLFAAVWSRWVPWTKPTAEEQPAGPPHPVLRRGHRGEAVKSWQELLLKIGCEPGAPDGIFGPLTEQATMTFQENQGLVPSGTTTERTWQRALHAAAHPPAPAPPLKAPLLFGARALLQAQAALEAGHAESPPGSNGGPVVAAYLDGTDVKPPANWCAAAVRRWLLDAADSMGRKPPIHGSVGARATMVQLQHAGLWVSAAALRARPILSPGAILVWDRSDPRNPATRWHGHIGIVEQVLDATTVQTIEGNSGPSGDRVARMTRSLTDPRLLGAGFLDGIPT